MIISMINMEMDCCGDDADGGYGDEMGNGGG